MTLAERLWIYQDERFPLKKTVPLLACFSAASITLSAVLGERSLPGVGAYVVGFLLVFILFFQLRVADEVKDGADDARFRPERPIPRGLVSLRLIVLLGIATIPIGIVLALIHGAGLIWLLLLTWAWLTAMTFEFGVPESLKARPVVYLLSHMAIMPLIDLLLTGIEWLPHGGAAPGLWLFIALSFSNGCVLELGRKLWAPENERLGVDTYSGLWGPKRAAQVWMVFIGISAALLIGVGVATGHALAFTLIAVAATGYCILAALRYATYPTPQAEKQMDTLAGLWVFLCYAVAGFLPLILGGLP
ncbi:4-hydroxybenzoate polyprenyltransferase [Cognatiyoonia koreensis]|uniref:4-hydroxybenzoate polyprenyltransferase n=1 Tax=Cognatiyoonia koreensis TaxID=364200 RepID=A0A1I0PWU7_9RHOB|nr:UbiA family prenyltransferase [Cognatiyoonia koreensis]SEW18618.1 4-hydroxybenzoate polyprenyltransferase [Cognatiyoonia koreensis]